MILNKLAVVHIWVSLTAWKVSKYGVISGPYFAVFGLNTEIYSVNLLIQSECRKIWSRNNSVFGHFLPIEFDKEQSSRFHVVCKWRGKLTDSFLKSQFWIKGFSDSYGVHLNIHGEGLPGKTHLPKCYQQS